MIIKVESISLIKENDQMHTYKLKCLLNNKNLKLHTIQKHLQNAKYLKNNIK